MVKVHPEIKKVRERIKKATEPYDKRLHELHKEFQQVIQRAKKDTY